MFERLQKSFIVEAFNSYNRILEISKPLYHRSAKFTVNRSSVLLPTNYYIGVARKLLQIITR